MFIRKGQALGSVLHSAVPGAVPEPEKPSPPKRAPRKAAKKAEPVKATPAPDVPKVVVPSPEPVEEEVIRDDNYWQS